MKGQDFFADKSRWPMATCPKCGLKRPHPTGGDSLCDDCRPPDVETAARRRFRILTADDPVSVEERRAERRGRLHDLLGRAGCPERYRSYTRASWESTYGPWAKTRIGKQLMNWTGEGQRDWLVLLYGPYGSRKTSFATALLGEQIVNGRRCRWIDATDWISRLLEAIDRRGQDETVSSVFAEARDAEVLLIDDLGAVLGARSGRREEASWWKEKFAELIRHREMWIKPTIVTANLSKELGVRELAAIDESLPGRCDVDTVFSLWGSRDYRSPD